MNYGFVIDNRSCIGCHACSTACKSENEVPLGVHRTWVKSVETGRYPDSRRHFQVTRCNHCANPPCVRICPTGAMYQRDDGIVEFDNSVCIGCKGCMQACPYDAIHIDPETNTAAKCHYCAHRVEVGREPACVVVCPEHAIIAGDMDDPESEISRVLAKEKVTVRKPEQGTSPKLFYIEGEEVALTPTATQMGGGYQFSERPEGDHIQHLPHDSGHQPGACGHSPEGAPLRGGQPQGLPGTGPIMIGQGRMADQMVQTSYNVHHKVPWHWQVPAYLVTKGIAAGVVLLLAAFYGLGGVSYDAHTALVAGGTALVMMAATGLLLIMDLERPERFYLILLRPQWRSWLARGAVIITAFGGVIALWFGAELALTMGWIDEALTQAVRPWALGLGAVTGIGLAAYTAFLFGQAEGRDLWQSSLLPVHLVIQAVMAGAAALVVLTPMFDLADPIGGLAATALLGSLLVDLFVTLAGEFSMSHASEVAARAAHEITHGRYAKMFWGGAVLLGHVVPFALLLVDPAGLGAIAGMLTLVGLYLFEHAFVMAPQNIPNS
jgi:Fe-S-cluster-containing dehydrogenase component/formate-dependent nitrite reductase membrane component NrfD